MNVDVHEDTISRWLEHYVGMDGLAFSTEWQRGHAGPSGHTAASNHSLAASSFGTILNSSAGVIWMPRPSATLLRNYVSCLPMPCLPPSSI